MEADVMVDGGEEDSSYEDGRTAANSTSPLPASGDDRGPSIPYFIPRRPRVIRMRDLSPATRDQLTREYFDAYDPWTGIRIAATLGLFISLFALFLAYKSRFHRHAKNSASKSAAAAKTSLYLYDEEDLSISSSSYGGGIEAEDQLPGFHLEEVYVRSSSVVAALKVKRSSRSGCGGGGGKFGTMRMVVEDASRSLPCSPLKQDTTEVKEAGGGSIASVGSADMDVERRECPPPVDRECCRKHGRKLPHLPEAGGGKSSVVVVARKPRDFRSRSTVVSIARRQHRTSS